MPAFGPTHRAVVLYTYEARERDELSVKKGSEVLVSEPDEEGWYHGTSNGRSGLVPQNYVRIVPDAPVPLSNQSDSYAYALPKGSNKVGVGGGTSTSGSMSPGSSPTKNSRWHRPMTTADISGLDASGKSTGSASRGAGEEGSGPNRGKNDNNSNKNVWSSSSGASPRKAASSPAERLVRESRSESGRTGSPRTHHSMASAKSKLMLSSSSVGSRGGGGGLGEDNYGEYLYKEGIKHKQWKEEMQEMQQERKAAEEEDLPFQPSISKRAKALVRDMPVVDRLLLLEQVKEEKMEMLKQKIEAEQGRELTFTPRTTLAPQKSFESESKEGRGVGANGRERGGASRGVSSSYDPDHVRERETRLRELAEKTRAEQGITHTPTISERSRELAGKREGGGVNGGIFSRLYADAGKRRINLEVQQIEAEIELSELLAVQKQSVVPGGSTTPRRPNVSSDRPGLYDEAEARRERRQAEARAEREREAKERVGGVGVDSRSRKIAKDRLARECLEVLEGAGVVSGDQVTYSGLLDGIESMVDFAAVSPELAGMSREEREVLCDRCWASLGGESGGGGGEEGQVKNAEALAGLVIEVLDGGTGGLDDAEPRVLGKATLLVFHEFASVVMARRLARGAEQTLVRRSERGTLSKRAKLLRADVERLLGKVVRGAGLNLNDTECAMLSSHLEYDGAGLKLRYSSLSSGVSNPRMRAVEAFFKRQDSRGNGHVNLSDLPQSGGSGGGGVATPRGGGVLPALKESMAKLNEIRKRLGDTGGGTDIGRARSPSPGRGGADSVATPRSNVSQHQRPSTACGSETSERIKYLSSVAPKELKDKLDAAKRAKDEEALAECTFKPAINNNRGSSKDTGKREELMERLHRKGVRGEGAGVLSTEEREIAQCCTFTPKIGRGHWSSEVMGNHEVSPAGACLTFDDAGVTTGDSRTRAFDAGTGRSPSPIKSPSVQSRSVYSVQSRSMSPFVRSPTKSMSPNSMSPEKRPTLQGAEAGIPIFCMDVRGVGSKGSDRTRITVYPGDDVSEIAEMFAERHGLAPAQRKRLKKLLLDNLAAAQGQEGEQQGSSPRRGQYLE